ncbi:MAG: hypothetical protein COB02_13950 [Candidatus Cloacimonadota bacterium]|nr:MAG: hypothetical protein COB02_13950 [Candidatus Cloacimonadota bacterium]
MKQIHQIILFLSIIFSINAKEKKKDPFLQSIISDIVYMSNFTLKLKKESDEKYKHELFRKSDTFQSYYPKDKISSLSHKLDKDGWYTLSTPKDAILALKALKKKSLLVVFDSIYCGYCKVYKDQVLSTKEVNIRLKDMIKVHVDVQSPAGEVFSTLLNSKGGTPRSVFVDSTKDIMETIGGYVPLAIFNKYLNEMGY